MPKKKRAANNTGSVYRRKDGRFGYSYTAPNGKQINRTAKTEALAVQRLRDALSSIARDEYVDPSAMTVGQWLRIWLEEYAPNGVKPQTLATYKRTMENRFIPELGQIKLQALRADAIQSLTNRMGKQKPKPLAPSTIHRELSVLRVALEQAVENRLILHNPAASVKLPKMAQKEVDALTQEETEALLAVLPMSTNGRAIRFILGTGLRVSELCGLRWCDLTEEGLKVNQTLYIVEGKRLSADEIKRVARTTPKTEAGKRFIPFNAKLREIVEEQRKAQRLDRLRVGDLWNGGQVGKGEQFIFATSRGTPCDRHNIARTLRECCKKCGIKSRGPHALRHTFATRWVRTNPDVATLSKILGHSNVAFTMKTYVHADNESKRLGMDTMSALI